MPLTVNGQTISEDVIRQESERLAQDPRWNGVTDAVERSKRLRAAAEFSATQRPLLEQAAASDPRPIEAAAAIDSELERLKAGGGCHHGFEEAHHRQHVERILRLQRTMREFVEGASKPSEVEVRDFYQANRENFRRPQVFKAAHIVVHVNEQQPEEQARARIEAARAELERGAEFSAVAECYSDLQG